MKFFHTIAAAVFMYSIFSILDYYYINTKEPIYQKQEDYSKKEWYPSKIVHKQDRYFRLLLDDGSEVSIYPTSEVYNDFVVGETVSFERHLVDPKVVHESDKRNEQFNIATFMLIFSAIYLFVLAICYQNDKKED